MEYVCDAWFEARTFFITLIFEVGHWRITNSILWTYQKTATGPVMYHCSSWRSMVLVRCVWLRNAPRCHHLQSLQFSSTCPASSARLFVFWRTNRVGWKFAAVQWISQWKESCGKKLLSPMPVLQQILLIVCHDNFVYLSCGATSLSLPLLTLSNWF